MGEPIEQADAGHGLAFSFGGVAAIIALQAVAYGLMVWWFPDPAIRGQFGDAFGVTNALFSGLGLAGLVYTLVLQQRQIAAQRADASSIRTEASAALAAQSRSNELAALTFLISFYEKRLAGMTGQQAEGRAGATLVQRRDVLAAQLAELEAILTSLHADVALRLRK